MVRFTRYLNSRIFIIGDVHAARCGIIAPRVADNMLDLDANTPQFHSFAFWNSLADATIAEIAALFAQLEGDEAAAPPNVGSVLFRSVDAAALSSFLRFSRTPPHAVTQTREGIWLTGTRALRDNRYRLNFNLNASPIQLRVAGSDLRFGQPYGQIGLAKANIRPLPLRGDLALPLADVAAGVLRFAVDITDESGFADLSARLRADFTRPGDLGERDHAPRFFPLFRPYRSKAGGVHTITLGGDVDPFDLSPDRSQLALRATAPDGTPGLIETHLVTNYGHPVLLRRPPDTAIDSGAARVPRFVFSDQGGAKGIKADVSLLPDGDFDLVLPPAPPGATARESFGIVCGLSEREYLPVTTGQRLAFRPDFPAYAGELPARADTQVDKRFDATTRSSWLAVLNADGTPATTVISEDREFSLFSPASPPATGQAPASGTTLKHSPVPLKPKLLRALNADAAADKSADTVRAACLPVFPWKGVKVASATAGVSKRAGRFAGPELRWIEQRVLHPNRRALVEPDGGPALAAGRAEVRHTPMGLEMRVDAGNRMQTLVLARTPDTGDGAGPMLSLELDGIQPALADALLRADLFLVADQLGDLARLGSGVSIAGWRFDADLAGSRKADAGTADGEGPILIIKGRKGPLTELLDLHEGWALPEELCSELPATVADRVRAKHKDRPKAPTNQEEAATQKAAFARIDAIFTDPEWTGVLIYDVRLDPAAVPDQVTGLLGGVEGVLRAHHVGLDVRRVEPGEEPSATPMFGTMAYVHAKEDEAPPLDGHHYAFQLARLIVSFNNGLITHFLARGKLVTERLFDGEATDAAPPATRAAASPVLDIIGRYERRIENGQAVEVYTFETALQGNGRVIHMPEGGLVRQVRLRRIAFVTLSVDRPATGPVSAKTRFLLDGEIVFNAWPKTGMTLLPDGAAFRFAGLGIDFDFELIAGGGISIQGFSFSPGGLSFDFGNLPSLSGMLGKLPFRFRTFEWWPEGIDLPKLGFKSLKAGRGDGSIDFGNYGLTFDLSLGSLGSLANKLKDFKLSLLLGFGFDWKTGRLPSFALGYKFAGSGGSGLDIGLGNVLRIRADAYDVGKHPSRDDVYYFYAINARVLVQGHELPKKARLNLFAFVDPTPAPLALPAPARRGRAAALPEPLTNIGWFGVMTKTEPDQNGMVSLDTLALGQKIVLFPGGDRATTMSVAGYLKKITDELGTLPENVREALEENKIEVVTSELLARIGYDPDRAWMIGIQAKVARLIEFGLLIRDPDLYGIHINFANGLIDLDILYRKLSDELGVYSVTIVPPDSIRRITTGPADIILPVVGLDFYTNGGFHADLGYPYYRDFSKSASAEILPFVGSGGMRLGLFRGGGSQLVPTPRIAGYRYDPVVELGFGVRVGLGKSFEKGPFRAGVSLTVFAYLEGAQGQLKQPDNPGPGAKPASTFRVLRGAVGILGEIYGFVDFGIIKARVEIVAYVEGSIRLRTDDATLLAYKAGVTVRMSVVIGRIKIFGKKIEIRITLSYGTTIEYRMSLGKRRGDWDDVYDEPAALLPKRRRLREWITLKGPDLHAWLVAPVAWQAGDPRTLGLNAKVPLPLWFTPDMTAGLDAKGDAEAEAVFKLSLQASDPSAEPVSPYDQFARTVTLWTIWNGLRDRRRRAGTDPHGWQVSPDELQELADRISGEALGTGGKVDRLPSYGVWTAFLGSCFDAAIGQPPDAATKGEAQEAVAFPMPGEVGLLRHFSATTVETRLADGRFVDRDFRQTIEAQFAWLRRYWEAQQAGAAAVAAPPVLSLAETMFEEQLGFLMRSFAQAAADRHRIGGDITVRQLLDDLHGKDGTWPLRSAGSAASRFYLHGLALERADATAWPSVRPHIPAPLGEIGDADPAAAMPIYRYASLQLGLTVRPSPRSAPVVADAIGLRLAPATPAWFTLAPGLERVDTGPDRISDVVAAADRLADHARTIRYVAGIDVERLTELRPNVYAPPAVRPLAGSRDLPDARVLHLPNDLIRNDKLPVNGLDVRERALGSYEDGRAIRVKPAIVLDLRLRRVTDVSRDKQGRTLYELIGAREADRLLLDGLTAASGTAAPPTVRTIDLYAPHLADQETGAVAHWRPLAHTARVIQSNLSSEPRPQAARAFGIASTYQAEQDEPAAFIELYRRASIVNSPGYWLLVEEDGGGAPEIELLLVARLDGATTLASVNALWTDDPGAGNDMVITIRAGGEIRLLPRPGEMPILVSIANPAFAYRVDHGSHVEHLTYDQLTARADKHGVSRAKRAAYVDALDAQTADATLRERFDLLEVHVVGNRDFSGTQPGRLLPVGNTRGDADPLQPPAELSFQHILPLYPLLKKAADTPYAAVGLTLDVRFRLRDIHGNALPGPARPGADEFATPVTVRYCDGLLAPADLPYLQWSWDTGRPGSVKLVAAFDRKSFEDGLPPGPAGSAPRAERLATIGRMFRLALWQVQGPGFSAAVRTTLARHPHPDPDDPWAPARPADVVLDPATLAAFFRAMMQLGEGNPPPAGDPVLAIDVAIPVPASVAFIEPGLSIVFQRDAALVHPSVSTVGNATETALRVPMAHELIAREEDRRAAVGAFALRLANDVLRRPYRGATGGPQRTGASGASLWLVRADVLPSTAAAHAVPKFVAMPPLSNRPESFKNLEYPTFALGDEKRRDLVDVDLDAYAQIALERIETLVAPAQLVRLSAIAEGKALIETALATKEQLAKRLSDRAIPLLATEILDQSVLDDARAGLRSRLTARLTAAYEIDTLLAYELAWASGSAGSERRPAVLGRLELETAQPDRSAPGDLLLVALPSPRSGGRTSPLIAPYDLLPTGRTDPSTGTSDLSNPTPTVEVGDFCVTHVQRQPQLPRDQILALPAAERYRATQWLRLLDPHVVKQFNGRIEVPVALRRLPEKPMIVEQSFVPKPAPAASLADWRRCVLAGRWKWNGTAWDNPVAVARYWISETAPVPFVQADGGTLGKALLVFVLATDSCWSQITAPAPYPVDLLRYLEGRLQALQQVSPLALAGGPPPIEDKVRWRFRNGAWTVDEQTLQDKHSVRFTLSDTTGEVSFENIDVIRYSRAQFGLELFRNRAFTLGGAYRDASDAFVYHLKDIWAAEPLTPHVRRTGVLPFDTPRTLRQHIAACLDGVFANRLGRHRFDVYLALLPMALPDALAGSADWPGVPIPSVVGLYSDDPPSWSMIADAAEAWLAPAELNTAKGHIDLWVRVYRQGSSAEGGQAVAETQPIFEATRLRIPLSAISDLPKASPAPDAKRAEAGTTRSRRR
ncbi:hypothetical protein U1763_03130 [Sphingomonas sp. LB2R24]|uniref:hypothetical protein n=1 Tax=Sphingomonas sorbitolis TaxID=3096165 RepID=UPI002FCB5698